MSFSASNFRDRVLLFYPSRYVSRCIYSFHLPDAYYHQWFDRIDKMKAQRKTVDFDLCVLVSVNQHHCSDEHHVQKTKDRLTGSNLVSSYNTTHSNRVTDMHQPLHSIRIEDWAEIGQSLFYPPTKNELINPNSTNLSYIDIPQFQFFDTQGRVVVNGEGLVTLEVLNDRMEIGYMFDWSFMEQVLHMSWQNQQEANP